MTSPHAYIADTQIEGDGDYMWGDGPCYFVRSHFHGLKNGSSLTQPRIPATHHGFVYVDSQFAGAEGVDRALLGNGSGSSEVALIDCVLANVFPPTGWTARGAAHNAEYHLPGSATASLTSPAGGPSRSGIFPRRKTPGPSPTTAIRRGCSAAGLPRWRRPSSRSRLP